MASALRDQTDEALMVKAQSGDVDAFAALYDRHAERAFRVARAICLDSSRAEDAVQEAFLAIWRSRETFRPDGTNFRAWSMAIVRNRAIDSHRKAAARPPLQTAETPDERPLADLDSPSPQDEAVAHGERLELLASLRRLPDAQAAVIVLAFYGELSHSEIARQLEIPAGTVKGRLRLGMQKLRTEMRARAAQTL